jgi:hypothetical protein
MRDGRATRWWFKCDKGVCLYDQAGVERLKSDPARCIKHGAILNSDASYDGLTRTEAKRRLADN